MTTPVFTEYLGVIGRTHGVDGTLSLIDTVGLPVTLTSGSEVGIGYSRDFARPYRVAAFSQSPVRTIIRLHGLDTPEAASALVDQAVYVRSDDLAPSATERYAVRDIEGATVVDERGTVLGTIAEVWLLPANDVWVLQRADGVTIPLPVIADVILSVDPATRTITVRMLEGLEDLHDADEASDA